MARMGLLALVLLHAHYRQVNAAAMLCSLMSFSRNCVLIHSENCPCLCMDNSKAQHVVILCAHSHSFITFEHVAGGMHSFGSEPLPAERAHL